MRTRKFIGDPDWPTLEWIEREYTEARLKHFNGNKTLAAKSLGIALKTLYTRLAKYKRLGASVRVAKAPKPRKVSAWQRKWMAKEARVTKQATAMVHALVSAPLAKPVPMSPKEWAAIEKRSCKTMGSENVARRSFMAAKKGHRVQRVGKWQEMGL